MRKLAIIEPTFKTLPKSDFVILREKLISLLTEQDQKDEAKGKSTPYRLSHYLQAVQDWSDDVENGADPLQALKEHFIFERGRFAIPALNKFVKLLLQYQDKPSNIGPIAYKKKATERGLEAKEMLKSLMEHLSEALGTVEYLRNNMDDVLDHKKVMELFEMSKKLKEMKSKL